MKSEPKLLKGSGASAPASSPTDQLRTGDPFKDFELDLKKVESDAEATKFIKKGRETTYAFIDLLYSTDWQYEKKSAEGIKIYSMPAAAGGNQKYVRLESKFG